MRPFWLHFELILGSILDHFRDSFRDASIFVKTHPVHTRARFLRAKPLKIHQFWAPFSAPFSDPFPNTLRDPSLDAFMLI